MAIEQEIRSIRAAGKRARAAHDEALDAQQRARALSERAASQRQRLHDRYPERFRRPTPPRPMSETKTDKALGQAAMSVSL